MEDTTMSEQEKVFAISGNMVNIKNQTAVWLLIHILLLMFGWFMGHNQDIKVELTDICHKV